MIFCISAGHNPDGKIACGAVGISKESTKARSITEKVVKLIRFEGHTAIDCTCNNGTCATDVLRKVCNMSNAYDADYTINIHLNAGANDLKGDGKSTGTEVCYVNDAVANMGTRICSYMESLGFKNRGLKKRTGLYFLNQTKAKALLIECYFCDDKDDEDLATDWEVAIAIVSGILGKDLRNRNVKKPLKIHKSANVTSKNLMSAKIDDSVECIAYGSKWAKVRRGNIIGWVSKKRLK